MTYRLTPFRFNLPKITASDTLPGFQIVGTDDPDGIDLVRVRMQVRDANGVIAVDLDSDETGITINDPETWDFQTDDITAPDEQGIYKYDIETIDSNGTVATIMAGTWTILEEVTQ